MNPNSIERLISALESRPYPPPLAPRRAWHPGLDEEIVALAPRVPGDDPRDKEASQAVPAMEAALHLWNDSLEGAHRIVQLFEYIPTFDLLHGIVHRREGDYSNSRYWLRNAGHHPAYYGLQARASRLLEGKDWTDEDAEAGSALNAMASQGEWNPYLFLEAVAIWQSRGGREETKEVLERLQLLELRSIVRYLEGHLRQGGREGDGA